jgi:hypothetical protein
MRMASFGCPGRARRPLRILSVCSSGPRNFHRRSCAAVLRRTLAVISRFREILRATLGEAVGLSVPWLQLVTICPGKGLLNVAWLCLSDVSRLRGRYSFGGKPTKPVIVRRSNGHNGEQIFGISAMWQLKILMAEVQQSAGQDFPRT